MQMIRDEFDGKVPDTIEELARLPGVGRKTANLIVGDVRQTRCGDGHPLHPYCGPAGLDADNTAPEKVENDLRAVLPPEESTISAIGWCSTAGLCAPPGKPIARNAAWRPSARKGSGPQRGKAASGKQAAKNGNDALQAPRGSIFRPPS